ncbi:MAG: response regulator [Flavobacteriales bacterium]|nr:response regulator [Flavobacteriales bacterium]
MSKGESSTLIYFLDDSKIVAEFYGNYLKHKYRGKVLIKTFTSLKEMLIAIDTRSPHIIFTDYHLDGEDKSEGKGDRLLKLTKGIPIVFISSDLDMNLAVRLLKNGATDYVVKDDEFLENLERVFLEIVEAQKIHVELSCLQEGLNRKVKHLALAGMFSVLVGVLVWWF